MRDKYDITSKSFIHGEIQNFITSRRCGAVSRKHFRADSPVFFDLNHGHLTLAIIMA